MPTQLLLLYGVIWMGSMDAVTITCRNRPGLLAATRIGEASNPGPWHNDDAGIAGADLRDRSPAHHLDVANCVNMPPRSEVHGGGVCMPTSVSYTTPATTVHPGEDVGIGDYGVEAGLECTDVGPRFGGHSVAHTWPGFRGVSNRFSQVDSPNHSIGGSAGRLDTSRTLGHQVGAITTDGSPRGYVLENYTTLSLDTLLPRESTLTFRPCREYDGPHPGMVFRLGSHGLGFYPDCGYVDDYLVTGADAASQQFVGPCLPPIVLSLDQLLCGHRIWELCPDGIAMISAVGWLEKQCMSHAAVDALDSSNCRASRWQPRTMGRFRNRHRTRDGPSACKRTVEGDGGDSLVPCSLLSGQSQVLIGSASQFLV